MSGIDDAIETFKGKPRRALATVRKKYPDMLIEITIESTAHASMRRSAAPALIGPMPWTYLAARARERLGHQRGRCGPRARQSITSERLMGCCDCLPDEGCSDCDPEACAAP